MRLLQLCSSSCFIDMRCPPVSRPATFGLVPALQELHCSLGRGIAMDVRVAGNAMDAGVLLSHQMAFKVGWFDGMLALLAKPNVATTGNVNAGIYWPIGVSIMTVRSRARSVCPGYAPKTFDHLAATGRDGCCGHCEWPAVLAVFRPDALLARQTCWTRISGVADRISRVLDRDHNPDAVAGRGPGIVGAKSARS